MLLVGVMLKSQNPTVATLDNGHRQLPRRHCDKHRSGQKKKSLNPKRSISPRVPLILTPKDQERGFGSFRKVPELED